MFIYRLGLIQRASLPRSILICSSFGFIFVPLIPLNCLLSDFADHNASSDECHYGIERRDKAPQGPRGEMWCFGNGGKVCRATKYSTLFMRAARNIKLLKRSTE